MNTTVPVTVIGANGLVENATAVRVGQTQNSLVDLGKKLLDASKRGDTGEIRSLMSTGAPFTTDWLGTSPLHFAAMNGFLETVTILLRAGISRDARTKVDRTPLHVSAQAGHFEIVQLLLKSNAMVDCIDMLKMTPLHWAVENGHTNTVNLLLKFNADISIIDKFDRTPMDIALANMQMDIVQLLQGAPQPIQHPVDQDIVEEEVCTAELSSQQPADGQAPVIIAAEEITTDAQVDAAKDDSSAPENGGTSVLAALAALAEATSTSTGNTDTASWLSSRGISVPANGADGTPFTLTEAGKLALTNFVNQQANNPEAGDGIVTLITEDGSELMVMQEHAEAVQSTEGADEQVETICEETTE